MTRQRPEFIIWATEYRDDVGGVMALYELRERLSALGVQAAIWPVPPCFGLRPGVFLRWLSWWLWRRWRLKVPVARRSDIADAVTIYPEVVAGNPLGSPRVVRWLLHKPGFHSGHIEFGADDLFFAYNIAFSDDALNPEHRLLRITHMIPDYRQTNFDARSGSAVLIRKGASRELTAHPPDAINVDNMSHAERAAVFNRVERLYCYDTYTFYTVYAALCGCVPIIIPEPGLLEEEWEPNPDRRLGLAYGEDRIQWAKETQAALAVLLEHQRAGEDEGVRAFVAVCRDYFRGFDRDSPLS